MSRATPFHEDDLLPEPALIRPPRPPSRTAPTSRTAPAPGPAWRAVDLLLQGAARGALYALHRPARVLGTLLMAAVGGVITLNALSSQERGHPAPLFGDPRPAQVARRAEPPARPAPPSAATPAPAAPLRPSDPIRTGEIARPALRAAAPSRDEPVRPAPRPPAPARDEIAEVLRVKAAPPSPPVRPDAERAADAKILAAQKALVKLGYGPLKSDGVMGAGTGRALERFEFDRRLPVTGQLDGRTRRELAAAAGIAIE